MPLQRVDRIGVSRGSTPEVVAQRPHRWHRIRRTLLIVYGVAYAIWFANEGVVLDRISVLVSLTLLLAITRIGRPWRSWVQLAGDLALYATMWLAYDETRGAADRLGMPLQVEAVRDIDRFLFGGIDPNVWMQDRFFSPDHVRWYDVVASIVYYSHFVVPVGVIAALWIVQRSEWVRFMRRFATVLAIGCLSFVLVPTAPPWMAAGGSTEIPLDALPPLERPAGRGWDALGLDAFSHAWEIGRDWANPVAAMPSLHAATALLVVVFLLGRVHSRWVRAAAWAYPVLMGLSLVYLAEHWVIDVLAGWGVVGASCLLWARIERASAARFRDGDAARTAADVSTTAQEPGGHPDAFPGAASATTAAGAGAG